MCLVVDMAILGCSESCFSSILASPFSGSSDLWAWLLGGCELWVYGILASGVFGCPDSWIYCTPGSSDSSAHLDLWLSVWMFAAGRIKSDWQLPLRVNLNVQGCGIVAPPMHAPSRTPLLLPLLLSHNLPTPRVH